MSWFGLFDRLRLHSGPGSQGWPLPGSQLRLADDGLASLYRDAIIAAGDPWRADMFDLAGHYLARSAEPAATHVHLDARLTGRRQRILFGEDARCGILAWDAPSATTTIRLPGSTDPAGIVLPHAGLFALLSQTLPVTAITTISLWAASAGEAATLLQAMAPWLIRETRAVVRLTPEAARELLPQLASLPAVCVAVIPCTGAPDHDGRGEDPKELLLCLEDFSAQTAAQAAARTTAPRSFPRDLWNLHDRDWRMGRETAGRQGGVAVQLPLPERGVAAGWPPVVIEPLPDGPLGAALAALTAEGLRAGTGFDYVAELSAATVFAQGPAVLVVPQDGPALLDPAILPVADDETTSLAEIVGVARDALSAAGWIIGNKLVLTRPTPIRRISDRPAFLLGATDVTDGAYLTEIWPRLEYLLQQCEQRRVPLEAFDILAPGPAHRWLRDSVAMLGLDPDHLLQDCDGVLFRSVLVVPPALHAGTARRGAAFDQFCRRLARRSGEAAFVSFSARQPPARLYLTTSQGPTLLNGGAIRAIAEAAGYRVIDTDAGDFADLAELMLHASRIVGVGAAMGWTCLAQGCRVGVLIEGGETAVPYAALHAAACCGHSVTIASGSALGTAGFALAASRFEALLERIDARAPALAQGAMR
jgi:hypothetical protein